MILVIGTQEQSCKECESNDLTYYIPATDHDEYPVGVSFWCEKHGALRIDSRLIEEYVEKFC